MEYILLRASDKENKETLFSFPKSEWEHVEEFKKNYILEREYDTSIKEVLGITSKKEKKKCRFCKKGELEVTFKKEAHVVSEQFGGSKIISNYECDECNLLFSKYESDLSHFLLLDKVLVGQKSKSNKYPIFKSLKSRIQQVTLNPNKEDDAKILLANPKIKNNTRIIQLINESWQDPTYHEENIVKIEEVKPPYYPINVFKAFLKIGLCLIEEKDLKSFSIIMNWLMNPIHEKFNEMLSITQLTIPLIANFYPNPVVYMYKSKDQYSDFLERTMVICFGYIIFQIPLYSDDNLKRLFKRETIKYTLTSPFVEPVDESLLFDEFTQKLFMKYSVDKHNLSSAIIKKDDKETRTITWSRDIDSL